FAIGHDKTGTVGMGHTRWATHGIPSDNNSHPHTSEDGGLAIIHNGIIENYAALKEILISRGYVFKSETDNEVLVHLIDDIQKREDLDLYESIRMALTQVIGAYAIIVASKDEPDKLIAARKGSPMVIGVGKNEYFIASDASPIIQYTSDVVYLNDYEIACL